MTTQHSKQLFEDNMRGYQTEERTLHTIRKCVVDGAPEVIFIRSDRPCLVVAGESKEVIANLKTRIMGDTLYIEQEGISISVNSVRINMVGNGCVIAGGDMYVSGSGRVRGGTTVTTASTKVVVGIALPEAPSFQLRGSADLVLQDLKQRNLDLSIRGSGDIEAFGTVDILNVEIAGSCDVDVSELVARSASLSIAGSGDIEAYVTQQVHARIAGSGDIKVRGNPPIRDHSVAGSGKIKFK